MSTLASMRPTDLDPAELARLRWVTWYGPIPEHEAEITRLTTAGPEVGSYLDWVRGRLLMRQSEYAAAHVTLIRARRRGGTETKLSVLIRLDLVNVFLWNGRHNRAERLIRKALANVDFQRLGWEFHGSLLNYLGRLYRGRGALSMASDVYRAALKHLHTGSANWHGTIANLLHAELRADRLDKVEEILALMASARSPARQPPFVESMSWLSYLIEVGRASDCEQHLDSLRDAVGSRVGTREHLMLQHNEADVLLLRGSHHEAATAYEMALAVSMREQTRSDLASSLACGAAESRLRLSDLITAEHHARLAIRLASTGDVLDQLVAHRLLGECLWASGRTEEARKELQQAAAQHAGLEFGRERARLEETFRRLGIPFVNRNYAIEKPAANGTHPSRRRPTVLTLRDGREFWSLDPRLVDEIRAAAGSPLPVLLEGETGTGKELVARLLHDLGPRSSGPFMVADCTTLPDTLVEAELFGAVRGAFTGCTETRDGIVARANGGTLLLDELPELSMASQAKLLRLLQGGTYRRVGEAAGRRVDARFIGATNRMVEELLSAKALKLDLFHRLNGHRIRLRPLRERREEIGPFATMILERAGHAAPTEAAVQHLERHLWPGNFRELEMVMRVVGTELRAGEALELELLLKYLPRAAAPTDGPLRQRRIEGERRALDELLRQHAGNVSAAARALGISRQAFYKALSRTGGRQQM